MVVVGVLALVMSALYGFSSGWAPVLGSQIAGGGVRNFTTGPMRLLPLFLAALTFCLKMAAMVLDRWSRATLDVSGVHLVYNFGLLGLRFIEPDQSSSTTYADFCGGGSGDDEDAGEGLSSGSCKQVRAGGGFVVLFGSLTLAFGLALLGLALVALLRSEKLTGLVARLWRFAGLAHVFALSSLWMWFFGAQIVLDHESHGATSVTLGTSWALMCAGWVLDVALLLFYRQAVQCTLDPMNMHGLGVGIGIGGPASHSLDAYPVFASESSSYAPPRPSDPAAAYHRMGQ